MRDHGCDAITELLDDVRQVHHGPMVRRRTLLAALAGAAALTGCDNPAARSEDEVTAASCIDWVYLETPADAAAESDAVVRGTADGPPATGRYELYDVPLWTVQVAEWVSGAPADGEGTRIEVLSLPYSCGESRDALTGIEDAGEVYLFLRARGDHWVTVTGYRGMVPAAEDGSMPESWPDEIG